MGSITPRWEWRAFGRRFGSAEGVFDTLEPDDITESDEWYLLTEAGDNVKVRAELIDIKVLQEVDAHGLERWTPVMKAGFPLTADDIRRVFEALRIPTPDLDRKAYTLEQLLRELVEPVPGVRAVSALKRRLRYAVAGCMAERSEVTADGRSVRTVALEAEDPDLVVRAVRSVGLAGWTNVNYPRGLTALIDGWPERYAVIDVGTNSVKFHLAQRETNGRWTTLSDRAEITRLGEGVGRDGAISPAAAERTASAIEAMVHEARERGALAIAAVGTAGLRRASNGQDVALRIEERSGVPVEIIPGDEESRIAYLGVQAGLDLPGGEVVVFDTGGGSSQFTFGHDGLIDERFSLDVGAVRFTEQFGLDRAVGRKELVAAREAIAGDLARLEGGTRPDALVGMGGAITNLTAVSLRLDPYDPDAVHGATLDRTEIERQIDRYAAMDAAARRSIAGLQPDRAEVILAGACIVAAMLDRLGQDRLTVSDRGLRHGVLLERFGEPTGTTVSSGSRRPRDRW
jgi:exopolyphosphatase/guanosine-5'-triphosphate,3'-diphosphate pyrophosphatase